MSNSKYISPIVSSLLLLSIWSCSHKLHVKVADKKLYPMNSALPQDSSILAFYKPYKSKIDSQMNIVIGLTENEITRRKPEGTLNNLFADAMKKVAQQNNIRFDFVHSNYKSLRVPIPKGEIKTFKIFELMPFENLLVTVKMNGVQVQELFDYMAEQGGDPIAGASFEIKKNRASHILINDKPLDLTSVYTILTSDYVANGGDGAAVYLKSTERVEYPIKVRDALLEYIKQESKAGRMISPKIEGRVKSDKQPSNE